jgi:YjbE family integral membrane protein
MDLELGKSLFEIIGTNIILSGDNAMVIALACRSLEDRERKFGIVLGAGAAVIMRIAFTLGLTQILNISFAKAIAAALLFWIAVKLLLGDDEEGDNIKSHDSLWRAVVTVMIADAVMSLDNVVAIAAAAHGQTTLIIIGLIISIPIVVFGSTLIVALIKRFPIVIWIGSAFLGWLAGEMLAEDEAAMSYLPHIQPLILAGIGAALVVLMGLAIKRLRPHEA